MVELQTSCDTVTVSTLERMFFIQLLSLLAQLYWFGFKRTIHTHDAALNYFLDRTGESYFWLVLKRNLTSAQKYYSDSVGNFSFQDA